jgi:hypothetical protein
MAKSMSVAESKKYIDSMSKEQVTEFNRHLKSLASRSLGAAGLIVACTQRNNTGERVAIGYWNGQDPQSFNENFGEYPYVYVSSKAAQKRADALNNGFYSNWGRWEVMFWKHPDYYMDTQDPIEKYLKSTGICFPNSTPRN